MGVELSYTQKERTNGYILKAFQPRGKDSILYEKDPTRECHTEKCAATWRVTFDEGKKAYALPKKEIAGVTYGGSIDNRTVPPTVILTAEKGKAVHTRKPTKGQLSTLFADNTNNNVTRELFAFAKSHEMAGGLTRYRLLTSDLNTSFYKPHETILKGKVHRTRSMSGVPYGYKSRDEDIQYYVKGEVRFGGKEVVFEQEKNIRRTN